MEKFKEKVTLDKVLMSKTEISTIEDMVDMYKTLSVLYITSSPISGEVKEILEMYKKAPEDTWEHIFQYIGGYSLASSWKAEKANNFIDKINLCIKNAGYNGLNSWKLIQELILVRLKFLNYFCNNVNKLIDTKEIKKIFMSKNLYVSFSDIKKYKENKISLDELIGVSIYRDK